MFVVCVYVCVCACVYVCVCVRAYAYVLAQAHEHRRAAKVQYKWALHHSFRLLHTPLGSQAFQGATLTVAL